MTRCTAFWGLLLAVVQSSVSLAEGPAMPLRFPPNKPAVVQPVQDRLYRAAQLQVPFFLQQIHPWVKDPSLLLATESRNGEHWIRPNTGIIEGLAFLCRFGPYDEKLTGRSRDSLRDDVLFPMMRYCVATHVTGDRATGDGRPWGDAWQSAHWAQMLGHAAWWTWDDLPEDLRRGVRRVVAHEADRIARAKPPHQLHRDTKAEENAWNSQILSIAVVLMPEDARRAKWETAFQKWALSAFLRPADATSDKIVDGRTVAEQFTGANLSDDFTLENHGFVHPDYMSTFSLSLGCTLHYRLTGRREPEALLHNVPGIYDNLKWFALPDGGCVYPNGQDWELFRHPIWFYRHVLMSVYAQDPDAWSLMNRSLDALDKMQRRYPSGRIYGPGESFFPSAHSNLFRYLARGWLVLEAAGPVPDAFRPKQGVHRLDSAKIVLHRTPTGVHSVSWGAKTMAMCVPLGLDRVISPHQASAVGHIRVEGHPKPLRTSLIHADVQNTKDSFLAKLVVDHGKDQVRAEWTIQSDAQGQFRLKEKLVALRDVTTDEVATGLIGVLNNPEWIYQTGPRKLTLNGEPIVVKPLGGKTFTREGVRRLKIEPSLGIESDAPLRIHYVGATEMKRGRATDELYLNYVGQKHAWQRGQTISEWEVHMQCVPE
ncbi:MAG: hypothetical protein JW818_03860 [Pirellulales bacterium]|nr:hypothetical protein [Pirellulales bacterium]